MSKPEFVDEEVYPPTFSAGGINAYYLNGCDTAGHRPGYAICLNKIAAYERTGKLDDYCGCGTPIGNKTCIALKMRQEELTAGKAIYFIHREKLQAFNNAQVVPVVASKGDSSKRGEMVFPEYVSAQMQQKTFPAERAPAKSKPSKPASIIDAIDDTSYAAVIKVSESVTAESPTLEKKPVKIAMTPLPGESLIDMAKRYRQTQTI